MKHWCLLLHSFSIINIIVPVLTSTLAGNYPTYIYPYPDPESNFEDGGKIVLSSWEDATYAHAISAMQN